MVMAGERKIDLRVSTLPTQHGEKTVIRLLDPEAAQVNFAALGLSESAGNALRKVLGQPQGMLLVTGPTGAGKTTTLYAALNQIRSRTKNIITVEDPVEYMLEGVNQVQVNVKASRTFGSCLRSILRQDPNVIMVGEIREPKRRKLRCHVRKPDIWFSQRSTQMTVSLLLRDSWTWACRVIDRRFGNRHRGAKIDKKTLRISTQKEATPELLALLRNAGLEQVERMSVPVGCTACHDSGYKGRIGIYEILLVNEQIRAAIQSGASSDDIRRTARIGGLRLMQEEALEKVRMGQTTLEEVFRVFTFESAPAVRCASCNRDWGTGFLFCPYCGAERWTSGDSKKGMLEVAAV